MPASAHDLKPLKVLEGVDLDHVASLLERCRVASLAPGEVLLTMGAPNAVMYMILGGRMSVHLEGGPSSDPVAYIEAGQTVGELSVLDARPASAYVVAAEPTRLLVVDHAAFWNLVDASHDFAINLLMLLAQRLRANNSTVATNIRLQREFKRSAMVDSLTGVHNRRWLDDALPRFVARFARSGHPMALLMLDIDHFKKVNDTYGHPAGDAVLVTVAHSLRTAVRPTDHLVRYGGEEFTVVLPETGLRAAHGVAERLRSAVKLAPIKDASGKLLPSVTISVGGAILGREDSSAALVAAADGALYQAKQTGRDRVVFAGEVPSP